MAEAKKNIKGTIASLNIYHTDAYAIAVRNGYKGTEAEWLSSIAEDASKLAREESADIYKEATDAVKGLYAKCDVVEAEAKAAIASAANTAVASVESSEGAALTAIAEAKATMLEEIEVAGDIVQTTGKSETAVMCQKAVTDELETANQKISLNSKRIVNLERGVTNPFETDDSVAYVKDVPANALPYASVQKIGGMTRKCAQLFDVSKAQIGYRCNVDGSRAKNSSYASSDYIEVKGGTSYYLTNVCGNAYCSAVFFDASKAVVGNGIVENGSVVSGVLNVGSDTKYIRINIVVDGVDVNTVMVNEGTTALPYEPYFEGLRSAKVTEVESVGVNLFDIRQGISSTNGCEVTIVDDSFSIHVTGADPFWFMAGNTFNLPKGKYYFYSTTSGNSFIQLWEDKKGSLVSGRGFFTVDNDTQSFHLELEEYTIGATATAKVAIYKAQRNEFIPYVNHTLPIPVEVRGSENLIPYPYTETTKTVNGITFKDNGDGSITLNGAPNAQSNYYLNQNLTLKAGTYYVSGIPNIFNNSGDYCIIYVTDTEYTHLATDKGNGASFTLTKDESVIIRIIAYDGLSANNIVIKPMLNEGTTALPYEPYSTVKGLDGYGLGVSDTVYNYIDWEKKQFVKRCAMVDLGTLEWYLQYGVYFYTQAPGKAKGLRNFIVSNGEIAPTYTGSFDDTFPAGTWGGDSATGMVIYKAKTGEYASTASFKAAMSGVTLVYELATPEVTDISDLISADNFIGVEGNGTLTFKNAYEYAVPSEVEYQLEV